MKNQVLLDKPGKQELTFVFDKEGEEKELLVVIRGEEKGDYVVNVVVDHVVGNNRGIVKIRGIAKNGANLKIEGLIKIGKGANKVDDFLDMRVLLLDNQSMADAQPKLEIEANDVKASHAAAVSQIDREQLFYLCSRGIEVEEASGLIIEGFLSN